MKYCLLCNGKHTFIRITNMGDTCLVARRRHYKSRLIRNDNVNAPWRQNQSGILCDINSQYPER